MVKRHFHEVQNIELGANYFRKELQETFHVCDKIFELYDSQYKRKEGKIIKDSYA